MKEGKPIGGKVLTRPFMFLLFVSLVAAYFLARRFIFGLGDVTGMNDGYPWGIWIAYDVVVGTAFACGGYAMALLIYVLNDRKYSPLLRPAILASLFGYSLASVSVFFDVGRYWQMYNIFLPGYGNTNSVLFEVALCIGIYTLVLWIEFTPTFLKQLKADKVQFKLDKLMFFFIALGILLPTMHQSSLGTLMIIAGSKLHPLWWSSLLPLLFLISSILLGFAAVIFESSISTLRFKVADEKHILEKLSKLFPWIIATYLLVRFGDIIYRGNLELLFKGNTHSLMFYIENLLFLLPAIFLSMSKFRQSRRALFFCALSLMLAGALYRFNCFIIQYDPGNGWNYYPKAGEIWITLGIIAVEIMGYLLFIKKLPVFRRA